jgi:hypothetical protein
MKKDRVKCGIYLPKEIYAELYRRQLPEHFSFLVACLLEEFFKRSDVSISREEMPTKAGQREYLKRKLEEFFSQTGQSTEPSKPSVQERTESIHMQERPKDNYSATKSEPIKEEPPPPPKEKDQDLGFDEGFLKKWESFW